MTANHARWGEQNGNARLTVRDVAKIRKGLAEGVSTSKLGHQFNVCQSTIMKIKSGATWPAALTSTN